MKKNTKLILSILGISLFINSCSRDTEDPNFIEERYTMTRVTSNIPVDYDADGVFETDLTQYFQCKPALLIRKNGMFKNSIIYVAVMNYTVNLDTGFVTRYFKASCSGEEFTESGTYTINNNKLNVAREDGVNVVYTINGNVITSNFDQATLVVDAGNGNKRFKTVNLEFEYTKDH